MSQNSRRTRFLFPLLLFLIASFSWAALVTYSRNTPFHHPDWVIEKRMNQVNLLGGGATVVTRTIFAGGVLHPAAWFGFQAVHTSEAYEFRRVNMQLRFKKRGLLSVFFRNAAGERYGVRLAPPSGTRRPQSFVADREGRFRQQSPLDLSAADIAPGPWRELEILVAGGRARAVLEGKRIGEFPVPPGPLHLGFKAGPTSDVEVRAVRIEKPDGGIAEPRFLWWTGFGRILLLNLLVFGVLGILLWAWKREAAEGLLIAGALCGVCLFVFDFAVWSEYSLSGLNPSVPDNWEYTSYRAALDQFEKARFWLLGSWFTLATGRPEASLSRLPELGYPSEESIITHGPIYCGADPRKECRAFPGMGLALPCRKEGLRLMFVGTSQTFGSGAETLEQTFFVRSVRALQAALPKNKVEALNISVIAGLLDPLWQQFRTLSMACRPDLVVINLGNNDNPSEYRNKVGDMLRLDHGMGTRTVLLLEANARMIPNRPVASKQEITKELAASFGVPLLDLDGFLNSDQARGLGFLWWDMVHLTPFGHRLVADWLAPQLLAELEKKKALP